MAIDFDAQAKLADLRMRVLANEPITAIEYRQIVDDLRRGREAAGTATTKSRKAAKAAATPTEQRKPLNLGSLFRKPGSLT